MIRSIEPLRTDLDGRNLATDQKVGGSSPSERATEATGQGLATGNGRGPESLSGATALKAGLAGGLVSADRTQARYQLRHPLAITRVVVGELGQHEPFLGVNLELEEHQVNGEVQDPPPSS